MKNQSKKRSIQTIIYITRDLERALPLLGRKNTTIITNTSKFSKKIAKKYRGIFLVENSRLLDTRELMQHKKVVEYLKKIKNPAIVVFKNTLVIEKICRESGWVLLNPSAELSNLIEEKISQINWLGKDAGYLLPPHEIIEGSKLKYEGNKFIVQFNRAHTGLGTILVDSTDVANSISSRFPNRPLKKTTIVNGPVFTANCIIFDKKVIPGSISYQITGLKPFTTNSFSTIGNDWSYAERIMNTDQKKQFYKIIDVVGKKLIESGWFGLFGVDAILDESSGSVYLLEINARQPASTSFESNLQKIRNRSTMELHIQALLGAKKPKKPIKVTNGAQIILRNVAGINRNEAEKAGKILEKEGFKTIYYRNEDEGSDLLRIMSKKGIIANHNEFNKIGLKIKEIIAKYVGSET